MSQVMSSNILPRGPLIGIAVLLAAVVLAVAAVRLSGVPLREPDTPALAQRALLFADRSDGGVDIVDAGTRERIDTVQGEAGFLRGALRALARERMKRGLGPEIPFELVARAGGRLTLHDPATGERLDLESFGPTNAAVFARLLGPGR